MRMLLPGMSHHLFNAWVESNQVQLPLIGNQHHFLLLGYQWEFLEVTGVLLSPHLIEDFMATMLEEDEIFGSYIDGWQLEQVVGICFIGIDYNWSYIILGVACIKSHPLFSTCLYIGT